MNNEELVAQAITDQTAIGFYVFYAAVAIALVVWLARTLYRNGEIFLRDVFEDDGIAGAVNHLLVVGFYLLNLGYALLLYKITPNALLATAFNDLVARFGTLLLSLGVIHLLNMFVFWRIRTYRDRKGMLPPAPRSTVDPPAPESRMQPPAPPGITFTPNPAG